MSDVAVLSPVEAVLAGAAAENRTQLLEPEALVLAAELGLAVPAHRVIGGPDEVTDDALHALGTRRVVVKVVSETIAHKSDVGGVSIVPNDRFAVKAAMAAMRARLEARRFLLEAEVPHDRALGGELLVGLRFTDDFGPVVSVGPGGVHAEFLAAALREERAIAILAPGLTPAGRIGSVLDRCVAVPPLVSGLRGGAPRLAREALEKLVQRALAFAARWIGRGLLEVEFNPVVPGPGGLTALDALARLGSVPGVERPARPSERLERMVRPRSIAIVGVSERENPGRIILRNVLRQGFARERIRIVKPGVAAIDGCAAVPSLEALDPVDLLVLSVDAGQIPGALEKVLARDLAGGVIVIPGGLGERPGTERLVEELRARLDEERRAGRPAPVLNGANCLGIRSLPGGYDTTFIPEHKLPQPAGPQVPLAVISQSGAYAVSRASKLAPLTARYVVSVGNQLDLTVADWLEHLSGDPAVDVFALYVEGLRPGDGARLLRSAGQIVASGRTVLLYRAGRTAEGARATGSHTATVAGPYTVARALAEEAGIVVADRLADFEDLVRLFCRLRGRRVTGTRLGAISNAGFECVAIADALSGLTLAQLGSGTRTAMATLLRDARLEGVVAPGNPLDTTPLLGDAAFAEAARLVLDDPGVDLGLIGCVPLTPALATLPGDLDRPDSIAHALAALWRASLKPWVAVVDAGPLYDPFASALEAGGVPTFRTADRALALLSVWARQRITPSSAS